jgi:hypothetical protein
LQGAAYHQGGRELQEALRSIGSKDCKITKSAPGPDGCAPYEADCGLSGGKTTIRSHVSLTGTATDYRLCTETRISPDLPSTTMEIHAVLIGACPAGVKPGQIVSSSGEVVDPLAHLYGRPATKPTPAPKLEPVAEAASTGRS